MQGKPFADSPRLPQVNTHVLTVEFSGSGSAVRDQSQVHITDAGADAQPARSFILDLEVDSADLRLTLTVIELPVRVEVTDFQCNAGPESVYQTGKKQDRKKETKPRRRQAETP